MYKKQHEPDKQQNMGAELEVEAPLADMKEHINGLSPKKQKYRKVWVWVCSIFLGMGALAAGIVGGTYSFYSQTNRAENVMATKESGVALQEVFNPADQWVPGETKEKEVSFANTGSNSQVIRFRYEEGWYDNKGTPGNLLDDTPWTYTGTYSPEPAVINFTAAVTGTPSQWYYNQEDGWYYYLQPLEAGETTGEVIESVTFSHSISNAGPGAVDDFSNKRYSLIVTLESVGVNTVETEAAWGMTFIQNTDGSLTWSTATP